MEGKTFPRSSLLTVDADALASVEFIESVAAVMEGVAEAAGTVSVAAVEDSRSGRGVFVSWSRAGAVELTSEQELLTQPSMDSLDSYSVGEWTSAYSAI